MRLGVLMVLEARGRNLKWRGLGRGGTSCVRLVGTVGRVPGKNGGFGWLVALGCVKTCSRFPVIKMRNRRVREGWLVCVKFGRVVFCMLPMTYSPQSMPLVCGAECLVLLVQASRCSYM